MYHQKLGIILDSPLPGNPVNKAWSSLDPNSSLQIKHFISVCAVAPPQAAAQFMGSYSQNWAQNYPLAFLGEGYLSSNCQLVLFVMKDSFLEMSTIINKNTNPQQHNVPRMVRHTLWGCWTIMVSHLIFSEFSLHSENVV